MLAAVLRLMTAEKLRSVPSVAVSVAKCPREHVLTVRGAEEEAVERAIADGLACRLHFDDADVVNYGIDVVLGQRVTCG